MRGYTPRSRKTSECVADWTLVLAAILTIILIGCGAGLAVRYCHQLVRNIDNVQSDINIVQANIEEIKQDLAKVPNITADVATLIQYGQKELDEASAELQTANITLTAAANSITQLLLAAQQDMQNNNKTVVQIQQLVNELIQYLCKTNVIQDSLCPSQ